MANDEAPRTSLWIGIVTLAVLVVGLAVWFANWRPLSDSTQPIEQPVDPDSLETDDRLVEQALRQIPGYMDSTAIKSQWVDEVDGVDIGELSAAELEIFVRAANARRCTCGCGYTLAACRRFDTTCPVSLGIVEALRDSVRAGQVATSAGLRERPAPH